MDYRAYMEKVGVSKRKYVEKWLEAGLIPGAVPGERLEEAQFPDSARRPYRSGALRAGLTAEQIRAHMVKACLLRRHIQPETFRLSTGEFQGYLAELEAAGLLRQRREDGIFYYNATPKAGEGQGMDLRALRRFVLDVVEAASKGAAEGVMSRTLGAA